MVILRVNTSGEGEREHSEDTDTTCTFKTNSFGADISVGRGGGETHRIDTFKVELQNEHI